jgi:hypothetical protein
MNDSKIYIFAYRSENIHVELNDGRVEGDLNKVLWSDLENIVFSLLNIFNYVGKAEAVSYFSVEGKDNVQIGKKIAIEIASITECDIKILTESFLNQIKKGEMISPDLFDEHSCPCNEIVKKEVRSFLFQNSNKQIKQDLKVDVFGSIIKLSGRFGQLENNVINLDEPPEIHIASVSGLIKHNRMAHLKLASSKILIAYFNQNDFLPLHNLMLSDEPQQFILQQKHDAGGKKDWYLNSFEKCSDESLNFQLT